MARKTRAALIPALLRSEEPSIRWRTRVRVLGESRSSPRIRRLEAEVRRSPRVQALLGHRHAPYREGTARNVYYKWQGVHWVLTSLADLGYPARDPEIEPLLDRALRFWLKPAYFLSRRAEDMASAYHGVGVLVVRDRARRCASQQGNALFYATRLGFADRRSTQLAELLMKWQWPDGGWNCDRRPEADSSSFMETLTPLRGLAAYAKDSGDPAAQRSAERASEVFLQRQLFRRISDGKVMAPDFLRLHYPLYWHYDVLAGLKAIAEVGRIHDPRCVAALSWLEERELPQGGWPAEARYYRVSREFRSSSEYVDWGGVNRKRPNEWVTTDALFVLNAAHRLDG
jgi:hypothetical protein